MLTDLFSYLQMYFVRWQENTLKGRRIVLLFSLLPYPFGFFPHLAPKVNESPSDANMILSLGLEGIYPFAICSSFDLNRASHSYMLHAGKGEGS